MTSKREASQLLGSREDLNSGACANSNEHSELVVSPRSVTTRREARQNPLPRTNYKKQPLLLQERLFFVTLPLSI